MDEAPEQREARLARKAVRRRRYERRMRRIYPRWGQGTSVPRPRVEIVGMEDVLTEMAIFGTVGVRMEQEPAQPGFVARLRARIVDLYG